MAERFMTINMLITKRVKALLILIIISTIIFAVRDSSALDFYLWAGKTTKVMPDTGEVIEMWGFAIEEDKDFASLEGVIQVPGPMLNIPWNDPNLTIHLFNNLPLLNNLPVPVSIVIPGQITNMTPVKNPDGRIRSFTYETMPGTTQIYRWNDFKPGTYLYQSGSHPAVQIQMGLYGGIKKDAAPGEVYTGIPYQQEVILFYSEIDPALHSAVASNNYGPDKTMTSTINYQPKYFLINGAPYPMTSALPIMGANNQILVRLLNAGLETHVPLFEGLFVEVVAEDGQLYPYAANQYAIMLPAAKTIDAIINRPPNGLYPIFDHRLCLTNANISPGGMLTYLQVGLLPENDTVAVTDAKYRFRILSLTAVSNAPSGSAILSATASYLDGTLVPLGNLRHRVLTNEYRGTFIISPVPDRIIITSDKGGSDIKPVPYPQEDQGLPFLKTRGMGKRKRD